MRDILDRVIKEGDYIAYGKRTGDKGNLTIYRVKEVGPKSIRVRGLCKRFAVIDLPEDEWYEREYRDWKTKEMVKKIVKTRYGTTLQLMDRDSSITATEERGIILDIVPEAVMQLLADRA